jgi:hypothetical protein
MTRRITVPGAGGAVVGGLVVGVVGAVVPLVLVVGVLAVVVGVLAVVVGVVVVGVDGRSRAQASSRVRFAPCGATSMS